MFSNPNIAILGAGNMGDALAGGLISAGITPPEKIICADTDEKKRMAAAEKHGVTTCASNAEAIQASGIVILAVKPQIVPLVLRQNADQLDMSRLVISVAAGVSLSALEACLTKETRLIRAMPNIGVAVKAGGTALSPGRHVTGPDLALARAIFDSVGRSLVVDESMMDAVTGLSGSGPAYVFLVIEALADGGVQMGLTRADALALAAQTVLGAAKLLQETGRHPAALKDMVTSPGGTTIYGIQALERGGARAALMNAVEAATRRAQELGKQIAASFTAK